MALEDAGYRREDLQGGSGETLAGQVGVYAGVMYGEYQLFGAEESLRGDPIALGGSYASIANRVSYVLNLHGPSMTVDTMCSSSLTALHLACQDLKHGITDLGIAGGVNITIHPNKYLMLSAGQFISGRGHCESFGAGGEGYIPGEGVGVALLKRLSEAKRDGDHIYGIIKGSAVNHGGKTNGYSVPNPKAQQTAILGALKESRIDPKTISYIEAHGTGTKLGDPIEITGLSKAFGASDAKQYCWIGSVKSNIGHCESAAGIAGVTKVLLQMRHGQLVPSLHSEVLNPHIDFEQTPFVVNQELRAWQTPTIDGKAYPRIAGISSFGAGGSNAHVLIEEYRPEQQQTESVVVSPSTPVMIVLSAKHPERLQAYAEELLQFIQRGDVDDREIKLVDLAYTLQVGREEMEERLGLIVRSMEELEEKLQGFADGKEDIEDLYLGQVKRNKDTLAVLTADEDMTKLIEAWINKGKYHKLLDLWVKGLVFDWNELYGENQPQRISAPTYPFARERYWISQRIMRQEYTMGTESISDSPSNDNIQVNKADEPQSIHEYVPWIIAKFTGHKINTIPPDTNINELGVDSVMLMQVVSAIITKFPSAEPIGEELLSKTNISELIRSIEQSLDQVQPSKFNGPSLDEILQCIVAQKSEGEDVLCKNIQVISPEPLVIGSTLIVDESHRFFSSILF